jgi:outer membrane protein
MKKTYKYLLYNVLILTLTTIVLPHVVSAQIMTLEQCIEKAVTNNPAVQKKMSQTMLTKLNLNESKQNYLPSLNALASQGFNFGRSIDPATNTFIQQTINSNNFSINGSLVLFEGFAKQMNYLYAKNEYFSSMKEEEIIKINVKLQTIVLYMDCMYNLSKIKTWQNHLGKTKELISYYVEMQKMGFATKEKSQRFKEQGLEEEMNLTLAKSNYTNAKYILANYIGSQDAHFEVDTTLATPKGGENMALPDFQNELALCNHPMLEYIKFKNLALENSIQLNRSKYYPSLTLNSGINSIYSNQYTNRIGNFPFTYETISFEKQLKDNMYQYINLQLAIPIYNRGKSAFSVSKAKVNTLINQAELKSQKNQLIENLSKAYTDYDNSKSKCDFLKQICNLKKDNMQFIEAKLKNGLINEYSYIQEKKDFINLEMQYDYSKYELYFRMNYYRILKGEN